MWIYIIFLIATKYNDNVTITTLCAIVLLVVCGIKLGNFIESVVREDVDPIIGCWMPNKDHTFIWNVINFMICIDSFIFYIIYKIFNLIIYGKNSDIIKWVKGKSKKSKNKSINKNKYEHINKYINDNKTIEQSISPTGSICSDSSQYTRQYEAQMTQMMLQNQQTELCRDYASMRQQQLYNTQQYYNGGVYYGRR